MDDERKIDVKRERMKRKEWQISDFRFRVLIRWSSSWVHEVENTAQKYIYFNIRWNYWSESPSAALKLLMVGKWEVRWLNYEIVSFTGFVKEMECRKIFANDSENCQTYVNHHVRLYLDSSCRWKLRWEDFNASKDYIKKLFQKFSN
jgi:hypothetical protein